MGVEALPTLAGKAELASELEADTSADMSEAEHSVLTAHE
jgi:hypothetical protein